MTASLSPDCKESGPEVIGLDLDGLYAGHQEREGIHICIFLADLSENSSCEDLAKEYNRMHGERAVGAFSWGIRM